MGYLPTSTVEFYPDFRTIKSIYMNLYTYHISKRVGSVYPMIYVFFLSIQTVVVLPSEATKSRRSSRALLMRPRVRPVVFPEGGLLVGLEVFPKREVRINGWDQWVFHLITYMIYWGCNPLTNHLLTFWDIQVQQGVNQKNSRN